MLDVNTYGGSGDPVRDGACTPLWLALLIGRVDYDPCSNPRSHIRAQRVTYGEPCGLATAALAPAWWETFINPPYSRGQVLRWVLAYLHTNFRFLLRWDPSTEWFEELIAVTNYVWFPRRRRIEFEPPPGVEFSSNPFPHALYLRQKPNLALAENGIVFTKTEIEAGFWEADVPTEYVQTMGVAERWRRWAS